jgi:hypothetical protein
MSKDQKTETASWLRGDLPTWVAVVLVSFIGWGGKQAYDHFTTTLVKVVDTMHSHDVRISILEKRP